MTETTAHADPLDAGLTAPMSGLPRQLRRLEISVRRRLRPFTPIVTPFDRDLRIEVRPGDRLGRRVLLMGYSDREHAALLHAILRPGMVYVDVGAHIGQFTLVAAARVGPGGAVHAFEATGETYEQLRRNIALNGLSWVTATRAAVFERPGELTLQVCVRGKGEFNSVGRPLRPRDEIVAEEVVPAVTIDGYCAEHGVERVDLMKIDTEGAELQVLRGARGALGRPDGPTVVFECHDVTAASMGHRAADVGAFLREHGYELFRLDLERRCLRAEPAGGAYPESVNLVATKDRDRIDAMLASSA